MTVYVAVDMGACHNKDQTDGKKKRKDERVETSKEQESCPGEAKDCQSSRSLVFKALRNSQEQSPEEEEKEVRVR